MGIENKAVDWGWANRLPLLSITEAAALSLGYELGALLPVGYDGEGISSTAVPEYGERVFLAFQAARAGKLKLLGLTSAKGETFDPKAEFSDGQFWEIEPTEFRQLCDSMGWPVPAEFRPMGYMEIRVPQTPITEERIERAPRADPQEGANPTEKMQKEILARLRRLGGDRIKKNGAWVASGRRGAQTELIAQLRKEGVHKHSDKSVVKDLIAAAERELPSPFTGLGSR